MSCCDRVIHAHRPLVFQRLVMHFSTGARGRLTPQSLRCTTSTTNTRVPIYRLRYHSVIRHHSILSLSDCRHLRSLVMDVSISDLLGPASPFSSPPSTTSGPSYIPSTHVDLSLVDFDYVSTCTSIAELTSIISQLQHEPFPDLLLAGQRRLLSLDPHVRREEERLRKARDTQLDSLNDLLQWTQQAKATELHLPTHPSPRALPPIRGHPPTPSPLLTPSITSTDRSSLLSAEKLKGNESFKASDYTSAILHYRQALSLLPPTPSDWSLHTNLAIACIKVERWEEALEWSEKAIEGSGGEWVKGWWRKALALEGLARLHEALRAIDEAWERSEGRLREEIGRDRLRIQQGVKDHPTSPTMSPPPEEKEQLHFPPSLSPTPSSGPSSLKRIPIVADDSDSDTESDQSMPVLSTPPTISPQTSSLPRSKPFTSPSGMTIEVLGEEEETSVPSSYPLFARRLLALGEGGQVRLMHEMAIGQWGKLMGPRCQLSSEVMQAMIGVWRVAVGMRDLEEMELVGRVERLRLILRMINANARTELREVLAEMESKAQAGVLDTAKVEAVREKFIEQGR